jgi:cytokinin dehydrogenase
LTSLTLYAADDKFSFPTVDLEKSLSLVKTIQGAEALLMDQEFNAIKELYFDASQYDWVEKNYSTDFGKLVIQIPQGVFKPRSEQHLLKFIELANKHEVRITYRGQGHSTDGQTLCNSIIIDHRDFPKQFRFTNLSKDALIVSGHATWKELLDFTFKHQLTVPVVTDYLRLSVGGTLSIGGLGGSSFNKGSQADNVLALRILTFDGQILSCSKTENEELFHAALCSLGQMGIILNATLSLVKSKEHAYCRLLYYRNSELFLKDQLTLYSKGKIDHLKGFIQQQNDELYHVIEAAIFYNESSREHSEIYEGLCPDKIEERVVPYMDFVNEVTRFTEILEKENKWNVPHPWYGVLLPEDQIAEHLKKALESPFLTGSEPVLIYPLNTEYFQQPFFIRPHGKRIYLLTLLYNCSFLADANIDVAQVVEYNKTLYEDAVKRGGCCYLPRAMPSVHDWEIHFGKEWATFSKMKSKYDPHKIRSLNIAE